MNDAILVSLVLPKAPHTILLPVMYWKKPMPMDLKPNMFTMNLAD